jgi:hypothetical protein
VSPEEAIADLDSLLNRVTVLRDALGREARNIGQEWQALKRLGARRADHAASLLTTLLPHLAELERFAHACQVQVRQYDRDPFDEGSSGPRLHNPKEQP